MKHILLIEDDAWLAELYQDILQLNPNITVITARDASQALDALSDDAAIDLIVLDLFLPGHSGIEFLHEIASYDDINTIPVIVLSSVFQHDFGMSTQRWKHYGVVEYLYKPKTKPEHLVAAVEKQLAEAAL